jgi:lysozyme
MPDALSIATDFISHWEGFRDHPYRDAAGIWTIGYGFTFLEDGTRVTSDTLPMNQEDAKRYLSALVGRVMSKVRDIVHAPMTDNQCAALTSFAYNLGTGALFRSTLLRLFEAGDVQGAASQFPAWCYAGGHVVQGLLNRRQAEAGLFLEPDVASSESESLPPAAAKPLLDASAPTAEPAHHPMLPFPSEPPPTSS